MPLLDLAAGSAVSVKMVVDLAKVYHQDVDFQVAVNLLGQLGKNLLGILGVSAATPAVTAAVASLLKTVPGAGTIAGGVLQGLVQALITRWIGAVFITYFKSEMKQPEGGLASLGAARMAEGDDGRGTEETAAVRAGSHFRADRHRWTDCDIEPDTPSGISTDNRTWNQ